MTKRNVPTHTHSPLCAGCGQPDAVQTPWEDALCPACARRYAIGSAAGDHLRFLLRAAISDYLKVWGVDHEALAYLADAAGINANEVAQELLARQDVTL